MNEVETKEPEPRFSEDVDRWVLLNQLLKGSRRDTVGLHDPATGTLMIRNPDQDDAVDILHWNQMEGQTFLVGDWEGKGLDAPGFYNPETSVFTLFENFAPTHEPRCFAFGPVGAGWMPVVGDFDGDGQDGVGLYAPEEATLRLLHTPRDGDPDHQFLFGPRDSGFIPLAGNWLGEGKDHLALFDPAIGKFILKEGLESGDADTLVHIGPGRADRLPLMGDWWGQGFEGFATYDPETSSFRLFFGGRCLETFIFGDPEEPRIPVRIPWPYR